MTVIPCRTYTDITYAVTPQRPLRLDLRVPELPGPLPLVLYIPMGGMRGCAKEKAKWWLADYDGFAVASIECRVSSESQFPTQVHDCKSAVRWLRANAGNYGCRTDAIGAWGHSAGGLLAAMLATSGGVAALEGDGPCQGVSSSIQAACDECGAPHDFSWFARPEIKARHAGVTENLRLYLGGLVEELPDAAKAASPATYISPNCPPMLIIHGGADTVVPVEESVEFHGRLLAAGVDASLRVLQEAGHGWDDSLTRANIAAFFRRTLAVSPI